MILIRLYTDLSHHTDKELLWHVIPQDLPTAEDIERCLVEVLS
jgi:hypothetical protein